MSKELKNKPRVSFDAAESLGTVDSDFNFDLTQELKRIPMIPSQTSMSDAESSVSKPGFLNFKKPLPPDYKSQMLDVRFISALTSPTAELDVGDSVPFCLVGDEAMKLANQDAHTHGLLSSLIHDYENKSKWDRLHLHEGYADMVKSSDLAHLLKIHGPKMPKCELKEYETELNVVKWELSADVRTDAKETEVQEDYWAKIFNRQCRGVQQSSFITLLEDEIKEELRRCRCIPPKYELVKVYEDLCAGQLTVESMKVSDRMVDEYTSVRDSLEEPQEKLFARLKIYKRALCSIMYHFKALRPILREIKTNYDGMLGLRERQMNDIHLLKNNIGTTERRFDARIADVRNAGFYKLCDAEKRCFLLLRHADKQDCAIRTMTEILNSLEKSLEEEKAAKTISEEQRKKLIMEINDLRRTITENNRAQIQDAALQAAAAAVEKDLDGGEVAAEEDLASINDSGILRNALENTRKSLSDTQKRLTILEADYSDVVPRKDYEVLEVKKKEADGKYKAVADDYETLSTKFQGIKDQIDQLIAERDEYQELVIDLKFRSTPRPSWSKIAEFVEGGLPRWQEIYTGKSSKEITETVVEILTGKKPKSGPREMLPSLGNGDKVPIYLRYDEGAAIPSRNFTRREAAVFIHDVKQARIELLELLRKRKESVEEEYSYKPAVISKSRTVVEEAPTNLVLTNFADFFHNYMKERFPWPVIRAEWVYNLIDACKRLKADSAGLAEFLGIIEGNIDEAVVHTFRNDVAKVRNVLIEKSAAGGHAMGSLPASEFPGAMREAFPNKSEEEVKGLVRAAAKQTGSVADWFLMKYVSFFVMTDEGLVGDFIDEFGKQFNEDRLEYAYEIINVLLSELGVSLQSAERENDPAGETDVNIAQIYSAITSVDPTLPEDRIGAILAWVVVGEPSLPGLPMKGLLLARFVQDHIRRHPNQEADSDEEDDGELVEFERAIDAIRDKDGGGLDEGDGEGQMDEKKRKAQIKRMKLIPLRVVLQRLKGGCLFRFGKKTMMAKSLQQDLSMTIVSKHVAQNLTAEQQQQQQRLSKGAHGGERKNNPKGAKAKK